MSDALTLYIAQQFEDIHKELSDLRQRIDHPAWLQPTPLPTVHALAQDTPAQTYGLVIDTTGQIYTKLLQIISTQGTIMVTEQDIQNIADAINTSVQTLQAAVSAEDSAITQVLDFIKNNPGQPIPQSLVDELSGVKTAVDNMASDVTTQTGNLTGAVTTPPAP